MANSNVETILRALNLVGCGVTGNPFLPTRQFERNVLIGAGRREKRAIARRLRAFGVNCFVFQDWGIEVYTPDEE